MSKKGISNARFKDNWGWLNLLLADNSINDTECTLLENFSVEGWKIVPIPWYKSLKEFSSSIWPIQWMEAYWDVLVALHNEVLYVYNISTKVTKSLVKTAQISTVTLTYVDGATYKVVINWTTYTKVADATTWNAATDLANLASAIATLVTADAAVNATSLLWVVTITSATAGTAFTIANTWSTTPWNVVIATPTPNIEAPCTLWKKYQITIFQDKIIICNETEIPKAFTYDTTFTTNPTVQTFTWLTAWFTATCSIVYDWRLFLAQYYTASPSIARPNVITWSKWIVSLADPSPIFDFSALSSSSQVCWDWTPITAFIIWQDKLYIWKANSIWKAWEVQITYDSSDVVIWVAYPLLQETQTWPINHKSITNVMQDIIYYDWINVRRLSYEENFSALKDSSISENIFPLMIALPTDQTNACSYFIYPYYKLHLRTELSVSNDTTFVYNVINKAWSTQTGLQVDIWVSAYNKKQVAYFWGIYNWKVYEDNLEYNYDWLEVKRRFKSKAFSFWDRVDNKRIFQIELTWRLEEEQNVYVDIYWDFNKIGSTRTIYLDSENFMETTWSTLAWVSTAWANWINLSKVHDFTERYETFFDSSIYQFTIEYEGTKYFELQSHHVQFKFVNPYKTHY